MTATTRIDFSTVKVKTITTIVSVVVAVILPQIFHLIGIISGSNNAIGVAFLPMHFGVIMAGFLAGPIVGAICGISSPVISALISGMPTAMMVPFMMIELASYGIVAGLISKTSLNTIAQLLIVQLAGRIARSLAVVVAISLGYTIDISQSWTYLQAGLPGIALQIVIIPLLMYRIKDIIKE